MKSSFGSQKDFCLQIFCESESSRSLMHRNHFFVLTLHFRKIEGFSPVCVHQLNRSAFRPYDGQLSPHSAALL
jgi:hypothetical protein